MKLFQYFVPLQQAGTANFPEVAFIDIAEKDKGKVTRSSGSEGTITVTTSRTVSITASRTGASSRLAALSAGHIGRREHIHAAAHAGGSLKLPKSVQRLGILVSDVVSCPQWY